MAAYRRVRCEPWWEVVAAHHQVHDYAVTFRLTASETGISSGPYARSRVWVSLPFTYPIVGSYRDCWEHSPSGSGQIPADKRFVASN